INENTSYVGTAGYIPPEGPGTAPADLFSLGKVLYQAAMGLGESEFPELPSSVAETSHLPDLLRFNQVILKACEADYRQRYQTAAEMHEALRSIPARGARTFLSATTRKEAPTQGLLAESDRNVRAPSWKGYRA